MDAVSCAGAAPPSALLSHSFAEAAIARALHFSLSDANAPEPCAEARTGAAPSPAAALHGARGAGTHHHPPPSPSPSPSPPPAWWQLGPAAGGGRAGKRRRPRPSKRAPTTYISTDAATFRLMVQRVTGADDEAAETQQDGGAGLGLLLPHHHFGVVEHLLPPDPAVHVAAAYSTLAPPATGAPAAAEQPLFPTLDSWNVMYGKNEVV